MNQITKNKAILTNAAPDDFQLDERLNSSSFTLLDWPLSRILLKNNSEYPWMILVPRRANITEITQLTPADRYQLMDEMHALSQIMRDCFLPEKINIGALGNIVSQLHVHVVARYRDDALWPQGLWQANVTETAYVETEALMTTLQAHLSLYFARS